MPVNPEHIEQLVFEKLSGIITPENDTALEILLKEEPEAMAIWQQITAVFPESYLEELRKDVESSKLVDEMVEAAKAEEKRRKRIKKIRKVSVPAGIAAIAFIAFFIRAHEHSQTLLVKEQDSLMQSEFVTLLRQGKDPIYINDPPEELKENVSQAVTVSGHLENNPPLQAGNGRKSIYEDSDGFNIFKVDGHLEWEGGNRSDVVIITTPVRKRCKVKLADGTLMMINARTTIETPLSFHGADRKISINGEAFLKVFHDPAHPFIIKVPEAVITVLGTSLNVKSYDSSAMQVALTEGRVNFSNASGAITLKPGHAINFGLHTKTEEEAFDSTEVLGWQTGKYQFSGTPLPQVMDVIRREYGIRVIFDNQEVNKNNLLAWLDINMPLMDFMENIRMAGVCRFYFKGTGKDQELHIY